MEKKKKNKTIRILKKIIKPKQLILIILLLVGNTYAWFVYSKRVSNNIDVHVRAWKILFDSGTSEVENYFNVDITNVYPGMETYSNSLTAYNKSEVSATITYTILEAKIFDEEYVSVEGREDNGDEAEEDDMTSTELETFLSENYPFVITFGVSDDEMAAENGEATYAVNVEWPYESGNDELDTEWGIRAYDFKENNPTESCIVLKIKIFITQSHDEN